MNNQMKKIVRRFRDDLLDFCCRINERLSSVLDSQWSG